MGKWCFLATALAAWLAAGYTLLRPRAETGNAQTRPVREPARLVSMAPNITEVLFALGVGEKLVGVTRDSDYPPAARTKPEVGTFWQPSLEAVIGAKPDLVIAQTFEQHRELARRLQRIGYRCLAVDIETIDGLFEGITILGDATGTPEPARALSADIRLAIVRIQKAIAALPRVRVLWVVQREPLRVAGRDTFINEMIELAGGVNAIGPTLHIYPPVGAEQVIAARPDVIVEPAMVPGALDEQRRQAFSYWRRYTNVPAVTNDRIYVIEGDLVSRLGPRLHLGIELIARCLWPNLLGE
ncbi:MAG: helical backbone metal receptor [Planctomycetes bacterium]|jgi:iron complex transport system substrate-binding protein|nr:helical backbone metal receptor [Planctomycetota bacterium]